MNPATRRLAATATGLLIKLIFCCSSATRPIAVAVIAYYFNFAERGVANGIYNFGSLFGLAFAFFAGNSSLGWRLTYVVSAAPGLIVALLFAFVKEPRKCGLVLSALMFEVQGRSL